MTATRTIESSTAGNDIQMSTAREIKASTLPPRKPANRPRHVPSKHASVAATTATIRAIRVPYISREVMSRPRLSVPKKNSASPPSSHDGGKKEYKRSCSSGSLGASNGARSETMINVAKTSRPNTARGSCAIRYKIGRSGRASIISESRIQKCIEDVDQ